MALFLLVIQKLVTLVVLLSRTAGVAGKLHKYIIRFKKQAETFSRFRLLFFLHSDISNTYYIMTLRFVMLTLCTYCWIEVALSPQSTNNERSSLVEIIVVIRTVTINVYGHNMEFLIAELCRTSWISLRNPASSPTSVPPSFLSDRFPERRRWEKPKRSRRWSPLVYLFILREFQFRNLIFFSI